MSDPDEEIQQNWKRLERDALKVGLREGLSDGRESIHQKSFDEGYKIGFVNGYILAKYKGQLLAKTKQLGEKIEVDSILKNSKGGFCQMCKDKDFTSKSLSEIKANQKAVMDKNLEELHRKYDNLFN